MNSGRFNPGWLLSRHGACNLLSVLLTIGVLAIVADQLSERSSKKKLASHRDLQIDAKVVGTRIGQSKPLSNDAELQNLITQLRAVHGEDIRPIVESHVELLGLTKQEVDDNYEAEWRYNVLGPFLLVWSHDATGLREGSHLVALDVRDARVVLHDDQFGHGITSAQIYSNSDASPQHVVCYEYLAIVGTGTRATADKIYAVDDDLIVLGLEKPHAEYNSGWGVFEEDLVDFRLKNEFVVKDDLYEIRTVGTVALEGRPAPRGKSDSIIYKLLPEERYRWDPSSRRFVQILGRMTHQQTLVTNVYSDFATIKGNWFKKPREITQKVSMLDDLFPDRTIAADK